MIETFLYLTKLPGRKKDVLLFDSAFIQQEVKRAACADGSAQKLKLNFNAQG